jgi:tyrosyl-tRNA synthetase
MNFVEELRWRGMLHDIMPGTEKLLKTKSVSGYIGFDPTADSLHVGSLAQIMTLIHFQRAGHKPIALIGGATGMVGDPSGKSDERNLLSEDILNHNLRCIKRQLKKFLDFKQNLNKAEMVDNYSWFKNITFLSFIRDVGKYTTINYMMSKDSVKKRIKGKGMSFTEFTYQLVQGYDFYYLWQNKNCQLQMGGSDQWGNIVSGTELIKRKGNGKAFALTTKLIKKADGTKFGKTEGGNIWLDPQKTTPYKFYQFWFNTSDDDAKSYIKIFTLYNRTEIELLEKEHNNAPHLRILQKALAVDITKRVHGARALRLVTLTSEFIFNNSIKWSNLFSLSERQFLDVFDSTSLLYIDKYHIPSHQIEDYILDFLMEIKHDISNNFKKMFDSKTELKKLILNGGLYINKIKIDLNQQVSELKFFQGKYLYVQKGKKNAALITLCSNIENECERIQYIKC